MSDTDSFIDEVTEEVRRDRLYGYLRRYGWIAVLAILGIVGGTAFSEWRSAQERSAAEALGDALIAALNEADATSRVGALEAVTPETPGGLAVQNFLVSAEQAAAGRTEDAIASLDRIANNGEVPQIYRQIAAFKALTLQGDAVPMQERRLSLEALAAPGAPLRLLAEEQLALLDIEAGDTEAAITRLQNIVLDVEASSDLQQRASQAIVALGGAPEAAPGPGSDG